MPHEPASLDPADRLRLQHIATAARDALTILADLPSDARQLEMVRSRALVNCFTEIGEAASRLSPAARSAVGDFPWRQIIGLRNIVVHVYWSIDIQRLRETGRTHLPPLQRAVEDLLRSLSDEPT